jgi:hypothetical protein
MNKKKLKLNELFFLIVAIVLITRIDNKTIPNAHASLLFPPKDLKYFTLGYQEIVADILWIRSLQDIDLCGDTFSLKNKAVKSPAQKPTYEILNKDKIKDTTSAQFVEAKCQDGWSSQMLDAVTELAPRFKMPYLVGGTILSVVVHDDEGAAKIFKKGVERFPDDWTMSYRAAYHFMESLRDFKTASELLVQAGKHGAPKWVFALAAKIQTHLGQALLAKPILEEAIAADPDSGWAITLKDQLKEVNQIIEKGE